MSENPRPHQPQEGGERSEESAHFLRAVTEMAEHTQVVTGQAVYTDKGIKLIERGVRMDSRMYDRLIQHKLRDPIDSHLLTDHALDIPSLQALAMEQCETVDLIKRLVQSQGGPDRLLAPLRGIELPSQIAFKLTVMREQRPELLAHSLQMTLVAIYLALQGGWSERECVPLATAALLHDVGMLYMDPAWTDPAYRLSGEERKHLLAHTVTAMLVVRSAEVYSGAIEMAVLEHHERMDGSGYPRGLQGDAISPMGQILLLAEVVAAFFDKFKDMPGQRLSLMLRMNHRGYPESLVHRILPLLDNDISADTPLAPLQAEVAHGVAALSAALQMWEKLLQQGQEQGRQDLSNHEAASFVQTSLLHLQKQLAEAGSHPDQQMDVLNYLKDDLQGMSELALVNREARWQLQAIVNACLRRWPQLSIPSAEHSHPLDAAVAQWCDACMQIQLKDQPQD